MVDLGSRTLGAAVLAALALASCQAPRAGGAPESGVTALQFQDIPVPDGMTLRESPRYSHSREVGEYRYGDFVYVGLVPIADVSAYLQERMPQHSWQLMDHQSDEKGNEKLVFRRGHYTAECSLTRTEQKTTRMDIDVRTRLQQPE